jgi:1,4-dihydroxy-6-naphthoate synthase
VEKLNIAISPCPNDTFIFGPWILGLVPDIKNRSSRFIFEDIEDLNNLAGQGEVDVVKVSAVQGLKLKDKYEILETGGAFGLTHGPKLVSLPGIKREEIRKIAIPGLLTTAYHLLRSAWPREFIPMPMLFSDIPLALQLKIVDAGLLIHETALIYAQKGFELVLDLGRWWKEQSKGLPLPLGVILAKPELARVVAEKIKESLDRAKESKEEIIPFIKTFAQEMEEKTLEEHIQAYVNELSWDMGKKGQDALNYLRKLVDA